MPNSQSASQIQPDNPPETETRNPGRATRRERLKKLATRIHECPAREGLRTQSWTPTGVRKGVRDEVHRGAGEGRRRPVVRAAGHDHAPRLRGRARLPDHADHVPLDLARPAARPRQAPAQVGLPALEADGGEPRRRRRLLGHRRPRDRHLRLRGGQGRESLREGRRRRPSTEGEGRDGRWEEEDAGAEAGRALREAARGPGRAAGRPGRPEGDNRRAQARQRRAQGGVGRPKSRPGLRSVGADQPGEGDGGGEAVG